MKIGLCRKACFLCFSIVLVLVPETQVLHHIFQMIQITKTNMREIIVGGNSDAKATKRSFETLHTEQNIFLQMPWGTVIKETHYGEKDGHSHADKTFPVFSSSCDLSLLLWQIKAPPFPTAPPHANLSGLLTACVHLTFPDDADPIVFLKDS